MRGWLITSLWLSHYALVAATVIMVLRRRKEPAAMVAWIATTFLLPYLGFVLFMLIGDNRIRRHVRRRLHRRGAIAVPRVRASAAGDDARIVPHRIDPHLANLARIATRVGESPPIAGNDVALYFDAEHTFLDLSLAIEAARSHVHMEYYIFQPDDTGRALRDLLIRKAREGVRCRVLLDGVGAWGLPRAFVEPMRAFGVELAYFLPVRLNARPLRLNCRNHRKLVVIDGRAAFTGSQNIGDEYLGRKKKFGPWRDTNLRLTGPAAAPLQEVFVEDWHFATGQDLSADDELFPVIEEAGQSIVQIVATGPDRNVGALHMLLSAAVALARQSVSIITPYFVPDTAMLLALQAAALRGVRVQLLLPSRSAHWLALWAGRSCYDELTACGVELFEYRGGMLHSKVMLIDDAWSMVGSANMDVRSFRLNFELTAVLYDVRLAQELAGDFARLREQADAVAPGGEARWSFGESMAIGLARMASPLL